MDSFIVIGKKGELKMKNSVSVAKQSADKNSCSLDDIEYWEDVTHIYNTDENGEPIYETEHTDGDFRCYHCLLCNEEFNTFKEVKEHINE